jgi:hypothetical protein
VEDDAVAKGRDAEAGHVGQGKLDAAQLHGFPRRS